MSHPLAASPPAPRWPGRVRRALMFAAVVLAAGARCPERASPPSDVSAPCREVGQRCEFAPGKLGSCVLNDDCQGPSCYVCQSQH
jgi:hypothetical protein